MTQLIAIAALLTSGQAASNDFQSVWNTIDARITNMFYAKSARKEEIRKRLDEFKPKALKANSKEEFASIVNTMIDEFHDSHFEFLANHMQGYFLFDCLARGEKAEPMPHLGAWFKKTKDGYTIQMLLNGLAAEKAGLRKGDIIQTIDGEPFTPITSLIKRSGGTATITYQRGEQKGLKTEVNITTENGMQMFRTASVASSKTLSFGNKHFGYFHLWTMAPSGGFREALENAIMNRFAGHTDGMILDLRDGFGGVPDGFGAPLFMPAFTMEYGGANFSQKRYWGYDKPVVVIINEGSRSAKEAFSFILKNSKRATLVGRNTAGAVLGTTPQRICDWAYLELPIVEVRVNGKTLEDTGVAPDVLVENEFDANGQDLFLKKALEVLNEKTPNPTEPQRTHEG